MHPTTQRAAEELLAEANRLLQGNESLSEKDTIGVPSIFVDGVKELLEALLERHTIEKELEDK
ncbi:hypothetical protein [Xanthomonas arboricola]|uniref:hypothetical protein n=1 Tax=Xanthomonas arboricola TaxID=56448 RepID=UPI0011B017AB|nr:hypothetical protein [Xanthomonas arboricola]